MASPKIQYVYYLIDFNQFITTGERYTLGKLLRVNISGIELGLAVCVGRL